jgi:hypothetical protein
MDLPIYRRSTRQGDSKAGGGKQGFNPRDTADLDVPTFLRRQAD